MMVEVAAKCTRDVGSLSQYTEWLQTLCHRFPPGIDNQFSLPVNQIGLLCSLPSHVVPTFISNTILLVH